MKYLIKNFGLTAIALALIIGAASLETRLESIERKLDIAMKVNNTISQVAMKINPRIINE